MFLPNDSTQHITQTIRYDVPPLSREKHKTLPHQPRLTLYLHYNSAKNMLRDPKCILESGQKRKKWVRHNAVGRTWVQNSNAWKLPAKICSCSWFIRRTILRAMFYIQYQWKWPGNDLSCTLCGKFLCIQFLHLKSVFLKLSPPFVARLRICAWHSVI